MIISNFDYVEHTWKVELVYEGCYRIIDECGKWFLLKVDTEKKAIKEAKIKLKRIFANGDPNTNPWVGDTFVVLADTIGFRVGTHCRNLGGTGSETAKKGDIIVFDREGDENGFWNFPNDEHRGRLQGSRPWSLIYDERIKKVSEYESFRLHKEEYRKSQRLKKKLIQK